MIWEHLQGEGDGAGSEDRGGRVEGSEGARDEQIVEGREPGSESKCQETSSRDRTANGQQETKQAEKERGAWSEGEEHGASDTILVAQVLFSHHSYYLQNQMMA